MDKAKTRVLVADDHASMRMSVRALVESQPDMEVVALAATGREAIELAQATEPDVIVMDIYMPELDGIRAAREIRSLGLAARVVILSMHHNTTLLRQAQKQGVAGYVMKQQATRDLLPAIRAAQHSGDDESFFSGPIA